MKNYEVRKCANGWMVIPASDYSKNGPWTMSQVHVFNTWKDASAWLESAFKKTEE